MTGRFSNVRKKAASADAASGPTLIDAPAPEQPKEQPRPAAAPAPLKKPEKRAPLGVRVRPSLQAHLNQLVEEYRGQGWEISQHTVLEHFLSRLNEPEYAQEFMQDLAERQR